MLSRRQLLHNALAGSAAFALLRTFPGLPRALAGEAGGEGAKLAALLDRFFEEDLGRDPETATVLGLDKGALAALKSRLTDRSPAGAKADLEAIGDQLRRLGSIDRTALSGIDAVSYDCVRTVLEQQQALRRDFPYGVPQTEEPSPYVLSQLTGAYQAIPTFLDSKHDIKEEADAEAYLSRLQDFAKALDADSDNFRHDAGIGVLPADFLLDTTLRQLRALQTRPEESVLVASIARRSTDLKGDFAGRAAELYRRQIQPALERQIAAVTAARAKAGHHAGVWHVKDGEGWYRRGLQISTTTTLDPAEIHKIGLEQSKRLSAELDRLLKAQAIGKGSLAQRLKALSNDPAYCYANDDEAKAQAIADLRARLDQVYSLLPRLFHDLPKAKMQVLRVPNIIEEGQPLAYYEPAALDGSRPGSIYFNFADSREWPKWALWTTLYHEGVPGHHLQLAIAQETPGLPRYRANMFLSGYGEGWALYAEQLADELGVYRDDPLGRVGYLKALQFRAARLVVDTGLHHLRWSREKAIDYMANLTGDPRSAVTREIDRYCVWPGQACSYMIGYVEWNRLRDKARRELGARFDIRDFHQVALQAGVMPLSVLERVIDGYIKSRQG
jgi:uncharacterized protein (DUF885 family)